MWTVSYVLKAGGVSALLLALFYFVIDVKGSKNWTLFFRVFGMNSITIYMAHRIIDFHDISRFFMGWTSVHFNELWGKLFIAIAVLVLQWALMLFGDKNAYRYLNTSVEKFYSMNDFSSLMRKAGFKDVSAAPLTFGVVCIYKASKA